MSEPTLYHVTLNTGHVIHQSRADVQQAVIDRLLPILDAEGGPIPGMGGWYLDCMVPFDADRRRVDGGAFFQLADEPGLSKHPVVMAVACWRADLSGESWQQAIAGYRAIRQSCIEAAPALGFALRDPSDTPPPVPWLAAWLNPLPASLVDGETMMRFGDLERCIAWALIP